VGRFHAAKQGGVLLLTMSVKKYTTKYFNSTAETYRFEYNGWDIIVTISHDKAIMHGTAINSEFEEAQAYSLTMKRPNIHMDNAAALMVGELVKEIAINYALNCLEEDE